MAKIGTAHVEIKPVISEDALTAITERIAEAIADGVRRGIEQSQGAAEINVQPWVVPEFQPSTVSDRLRSCPCRKENGGSGICGCVLGGPTITC